MNESSPPSEPPRYIVGDFINLELGFEHTMHVLDAQLVFEYEEDPSIAMILEGELEAAPIGGQLFAHDISRRDCTAF